MSRWAAELVPAVERMLVLSAAPTLVTEIKLLLTLLATRAGTVLLTGSPVAFPDQPPAQRLAAIHAWRTSALPPFRKAGTGLVSVLLLIFYRASEFAQRAVGYPIGPATDYTKHRPADSGPQEEVYPYTFLNDTLAADGDRDGAAPGPLAVDTDVVVIGSGSGGSVAAAHIAASGLRVLVVDKGIYVHPSQYTGRELDGYQRLYDGEGLLLSSDGGMAVISGATFGGGSTINWSACLKPRAFARRAWASAPAAGGFGVPYFAHPQFTADLNFVCERMGATTAHTHHNLANSLLALGSQRTGMEVLPVPQNTGEHTHFCGKCQYGCPGNEKQGAINTWLRDAAEHGAQFMTRTAVKRVLFDDPQDARRATGVLATVAGRDLTIRASTAVVVAAGSMQTPAVLLRTPQLKANPQIGRNLHLHPVSIVVGLYDFPVDPWEGGLLTTVNNAAELVDARGWGAKVEVIASAPSFTAALLGRMGAEHKKLMMQYKHSFAMLVLTRDRDGGTITVDSKGRMQFSYKVSAHDERSLTGGVLVAADVHMGAGAKAVYTGQVDVPPFEVGDDVVSVASPGETTPLVGTTYPPEAVQRDLSSPRYQAWRAQVTKTGFPHLSTTIGSAHQMSSCRMAASAKHGACDPLGRVHGARGLYVADASLMPEASGVNPMVTAMACAKHAARTVVSDAGKPVGAQPPSLAADAAATSKL